MNILIFFHSDCEPITKVDIYMRVYKGNLVIVKCASLTVSYITQLQVMILISSCIR